MSANPEIFLLWREIKLGVPAPLTNPDLLTIQQAWRSSEDFLKRTIATRDACNALGDGIWEDLCMAGLNAVTEADQDHDERIEALDRRIAACESEILRRPMKRQRSDLAWKAATSLSEAWGLENVTPRDGEASRVTPRDAPQHPHDHHEHPDDPF